jgi:uncharacterized protein (UPF0335 family)
MMTVSQLESVINRLERLELEVKVLHDRQAQQPKQLDVQALFPGQLQKISQQQRQQSHFRKHNNEQQVVLKEHQVQQQIKVLNDCGFCAGDRVQIVCDRMSFFSKKGRHTPTVYEGKLGTIVRVTRCYVWISLDDINEKVPMKKDNDNVRLIVPPAITLKIGHSAGESVVLG